MSIHQLKVTLATIAPPIWRRLHVRSEATLAELHLVLQNAMGWEDYHLHFFEVGWTRYGGGEGRDETAVTLGGVLPREGDRMMYRYASAITGITSSTFRRSTGPTPALRTPAARRGDGPVLPKTVAVRMATSIRSRRFGLARDRVTARSESRSTALTTPRPLTSPP